jgi:hypothetical protein
MSTTTPTPTRLPVHALGDAAGDGFDELTVGRGDGKRAGIGFSAGRGKGAGGAVSATLGAIHTGGDVCAGSFSLGSAAVNTCAHIGQRTVLPATP